MSFSGLAKFFIGFLMAIALMVGAGVAAGLYFVTKLTAPPDKPIFPNDKPALKAQVSPPPGQKLSNSKSPPASSTPALTDSPSATTADPNSTPAESESSSAKPLEPGAYRASITWSSGLILRNSPNVDGQRIGGVAYKQRVVVLAESDDKKWLKIRVEDGNTEGWVKAGNLERIDDSQSGQASNQ